MKKFIIIIMVLILIFIVAIIIVFKNKTTVNIYSKVNNISLKVNEKEYKNVTNLGIKLFPGKYKIKATKIDYLDHEEEITVNGEKNYNLEISLQIKPEVKEEIKKIIKQFIIEQKLDKQDNWSIKIGEIKNDQAEAIIIPNNKIINSGIIILKKENDQWKIEKMGTDIILSDSLKEKVQTGCEESPLDEYLPYTENNFKMKCIPQKNNSPTYKISLNVPTEKPVEIKNKLYFKYKIDALEWILSKDIDYKNLKIEWVIEEASPIL